MSDELFSDEVDKLVNSIVAEVGKMATRKDQVAVAEEALMVYTAGLHFLMDSLFEEPIERGRYINSVVKLLSGEFQND